MNAKNQYIQEVLRNIHGTAQERSRIETDLSDHLNEAVAAGEPLDNVIRRMGTPVEVAAAFMSQKPMDYAGFWMRAIASVLDMLLIFILAGLLMIPVIGLNQFIPAHPSGIGYVQGAAVILIILGCVLALLGVIILYFPVLEGRFGQTPGKRLLHLRVLKENGLPIGYKDAFLRRLSYYTEFLLFDGLFIPFTQKKQRALDIVARTVVIVEQ